MHPSYIATYIRVSVRMLYPLAHANKSYQHPPGRAKAEPPSPTPSQTRGPLIGPYDTNLYMGCMLSPTARPHPNQTPLTLQSNQHGLRTLSPHHHSTHTLPPPAHARNTGRHKHLHRRDPKHHLLPPAYRTMDTTNNNDHGHRLKVRHA